MNATQKKTAVKNSAKSIAKLLKNHTIARSGQGNKFWIVQLDEEYTFICDVRKSAAGNAYLVPTEDSLKGEDPFHISLGSHYSAIETFIDDDDESIQLLIKVSPRTVNPSVTQSDLDSVSEKYGESAIAGYLKAKATGESTIVLTSYSELD